ncbi:MAG: YdiU family protein [Gammaproteobacteria bacterium]|nr:YdiU family protein [Gammaproteobacteria bacterium]
MPELNFDNAFVRELPADPERKPNPRHVFGSCYSRVMPQPVPAPQLIAWSAEMAAELGLEAQDLQSPAWVETLAGNRLLPGMQPYAACYGGHQFGSWAGQLGDGRALSLGEIVNAQGRRWELQLKGAGLTPYSRTADGRAVLRSSLREFLCSEAMHHLGIPTTRALSLVLTGEPIVRDMFYDGHPEAEPGAITCRVAPSFIRFGNFEIFAARSEHDILRQLVDFTLRRDFPAMLGPDDELNDELLLAWFDEIARRTALMVAHWMRVGFVHGVMNTDNMSILGLTIDYGPYGWLEDFDPEWTPNTTDAATRRYCYGQQPRIAQWNLMCLAKALSALMQQPESLQQGLQTYADAYAEHALRMTTDKLGLATWQDGDEKLIETLFPLLQAAELDMTLFWRLLADQDSEQADASALQSASYNEQAFAAQHQALQQWLQDYLRRRHQDRRQLAEIRSQMHAASPKYVLRNYLAQQAIDQAAAGDYSEIDRLLQIMRKPYDEQPEHAEYAAKRPEWARDKAGCSMLSCSS